MAANSKAKAGRSGYARDIMPDRLESDELSGRTVPVANAAGVQEGIVPPAQRQYKARYKAVDLREAELNMAKRARGEMPPIKNGMDDPAVMKFPEPKRGNVRTIARPTPEAFDPLGEVEQPEPLPGDLAAEEQALARRAAPMPMISHPVSAAMPGESKTYVSDTPEQVYLMQRNRVSLEMPDGTMAMSCISVIESQYGVTILLPLSKEGSIFMPKPGTSVTVVRGEKRWPAYFPGTSFEIPELSMMGLVFVKAEE